MSVLVYLKNMPYSKNAVAFGGLLTELMNSTLTLLQVRDSKITDEELQRDFDSAFALVQGLTVDRKIREGSTSENILQEINTGDYAMIVLRARRAIRYRQRLGKKVARRVAQESPIPVLIVKDADHAPVLKRMLICTGGKDFAIPVIRKGAALAGAANLTEKQYRSLLKKIQSESREITTDVTG